MQPVRRGIDAWRARTPHENKSDAVRTHNAAQPLQQLGDQARRCELIERWVRDQLQRGELTVSHVRFISKGAMPFAIISLAKCERE